MNFENVKTKGREEKEKETIFACFWQLTFGSLFLSGALVWRFTTRLCHAQHSHSLVVGGASCLARNLKKMKSNEKRQRSQRELAADQTTRVFVCATPPRRAVPAHLRLISLERSQL